MRSFAPISDHAFSALRRFLARPATMTIFPFGNPKARRLSSMVTDRNLCSRRNMVSPARNIRCNNSRYQVPLITLNPQHRHTPSPLNFRVILIFRQLLSACSIVSALLTFAARSRLALASLFVRLPLASSRSSRSAPATSYSREFREERRERPCRSRGSYHRSWNSLARWRT